MGIRGCRINLQLDFCRFSAICARFGGVMGSRSLPVVRAEGITLDGTPDLEMEWNMRKHITISSGQTIILQIQNIKGRRYTSLRETMPTSLPVLVTYA